uniref:Uncharacterized protein n=1 Tax=Anguilla anguilla TaxID=7936 RepID=A0A0E9U1H0_ANGAN
MKESQLWGPSL